MTKISLLNAEILRMHLSSKEMTCQAMDSIDKDLQDWHDLLPSEMHLPNLCRQDLTVEARRSILATHLLYLGTRMLLYRRIASQFVWPSPTPESNTESNTARESYQDNLLTHADHAITAAKQSSRILGLLQAEKGIFKKCWMIMYVSAYPFTPLPMDSILTTCPVSSHTPAALSFCIVLPRSRYTTFLDPRGKMTSYKLVCASMCSLSAALSTRWHSNFEIAWFLSTTNSRRTSSLCQVLTHPGAHRLSTTCSKFRQLLIPIVSVSP